MTVIKRRIRNAKRWEEKKKIIFGWIPGSVLSHTDLHGTNPQKNPQIKTTHEKWVDGGKNKRSRHGPYALKSRIFTTPDYIL